MEPKFILVSSKSKDNMQMNREYEGEIKINIGNMLDIRAIIG